jgi:hypothetical protein
MPEWDLPNGIGYAPDADQRMYQPPVVAEPFAPPTVSATAANGLVSGTVVEKAHGAAEHAKTMWHRHIDETNKSKQHYTTEGYQAQLAKFADTGAAKAVDTEVGNLQASADQAAAKLAKIMTGLSPDGDTAAELRAGRFWDRTKPLLDNAKEGAVSRAQKLITTASREELGTLLQELPAYLEAHNQPTSWIESAVSQVVPEYGQAVKRNRLAQKALTIGKYNADNLRRTFAEGHAGSPLVLADLRGYDPDKAL